MGRNHVFIPRSTAQDRLITNPDVRFLNINTAEMDGVKPRLWRCQELPA